MVQVKYIKRGNKLHGPYYYETYRDENGLVKKRYLGKSLEERSKFFNWGIFFVILLIGILAFGFYFEARGVARDSLVNMIVRESVAIFGADVSSENRVMLAPSASISASRISCVAPCAVFFDATGTTSGTTARPFHDLYYFWNFGDLSSETWATNGKSKNYATGAVAAHVFEPTAGEYDVNHKKIYTVGLQVKDLEGNSSDSVQIEVVDPDWYFSPAGGGQTYCLSQTSGTFLGCPLDTNGDGTCDVQATNCVVATSISDIQSRIGANRRILLRRGDTWTGSNGVFLNAGSVGILGAFGNNPNKPIIQVTGLQTDVYGAKLVNSDWIIKDIKFDGPGAFYSTGGNDLVGVSFNGNDGLNKGFIEGVEVTNWWTGIANGRVETNYYNDLFVVDSYSHDNGYGMFVGTTAGNNLALLGNTVENTATHAIRVWEANNAVISNNFVQNFGSTSAARLALKLHAPTWSFYYPDGTERWTEKVIVSDNEFWGGQWTIVVAPESESGLADQQKEIDERVRDVIIERNVIGAEQRTDYYSSGIGIRIAASDVTVRNNLYYASDPHVDSFGVTRLVHTTKYVGNIDSFAVSADPTGVHVYNNVLFRNDDGDVYLISESSQIYSDNQYFNNLAYASGGSSANVVVPGTVASGDNIIGTAGDFESVNFGDSNFLHLTSGSSAVNSGTSVLVYDDFNLGLRTDGQIDIGAFEYGATGGFDCNFEGCPVGNTCISYICEIDGSCTSNYNDGVSCDDDNACTNGELCNAGLCSGGISPVCGGVDGCCPDGCTNLDDNDCSAPQSNIVLHLDFNGNMNDRSAKGNNGTCSGASCPVLTADKDGNANSAYSFDGGDHVDCGSDASLNLNNDFTLAAWIKPKSFPEDQSIVMKGIHTEGPYDPRQYELGLRYDEARFVTYVSGWNSRNTSGANLQLNTWQHVVYAKNESNGRFYVDGVAMDSNSIPASLPANVYSLYVGGIYDSGTNEGFNGDIDDVRIYNRALSQSEILNIFNGRGGGSYNAGFRIDTFSYVNSSGGVKSLDVGIWYPTLDAASLYQYSGTSPSKLGTVAFNGTISDSEDFPLVIFSHGYGGCGLQSLFFTEELARMGFVVVAPDHNDAGCSVNGSGEGETGDAPGFSTPELWNESYFLDRKEDVSAVIDYLLASQDFADKVDSNKIGIAGHSLGGYTAVGVTGGWQSWKDGRIKAALLFSPYVRPYSINSNLSKINIPLMYQGGTRDSGITPFLQSAYDYANPPKFFLNITGARHFAWTNTACLGHDNINECLDKDETVQAINNYGIAFLERYLDDNLSAETQLTTTAPILDSYQYELPSCGNDICETGYYCSEENECRKMDSIYRCGHFFSSPGTYVLTGDVRNEDGSACNSSGLLINSSDVYIDCNGYKIYGVGNGKMNPGRSAGIFGNPYNNAAPFSDYYNGGVKNCEISGVFTDGIHWAIRNGILENNKIEVKNGNYTNYMYCGVFLIGDGSENTVIKNNIIRARYDDVAGYSMNPSGIVNDEAQYIKYINNSFFGFFKNPDYDAHPDYYPHPHSGSGIVTMGRWLSNQEIANNTFDGNYFGVYSYGMLYSQVTGNVFLNNTRGFAGYTPSNLVFGLLPTFKGNVFRDNVFENNSVGFEEVYHFVNGTEVYNYCKNGFVGLVSQCYENDIDSSNTINGKPILYYTPAYRSAPPIINGAEIGYLSCAHCQNTVISNSYLNEGNNYGIYLYNGTNVTVENSEISKKEIGLFVAISKKINLVNLNFYDNLRNCSINDSEEVSCYGGLCGCEGLGSVCDNDGNCESGEDEFNCPADCLVVCDLTSANWNANEVVHGAQVTLTAEGNNCAGQNINFTIYEDDLAIDDLVVSLDSIVFPSMNWTAVWTYPGDDDIGTDERDYYFVATVSDDAGESATSGILKVNSPGAASCGNSLCESGENVYNCSADCLNWTRSCLTDMNGDNITQNADAGTLYPFFGNNCTFDNNSLTDWCSFMDVNRDGEVNETDTSIISTNVGPFLCNCSVGPELCDGYDNDCDGSTDEEGVCPRCGNNWCENGENSGNCPADCPVSCETGADMAPYGNCNGCIEQNEIYAYIASFVRDEVKMNELTEAINSYLLASGCP